MEGVSPELLDKLFAAPLLFAFIIIKWSDYRIKKQMLDIIDKALNSKKQPL